MTILKRIMDGVTADPGSILEAKWKHTHEISRHFTN
jgi:hypothetical protein